MVFPAVRLTGCFPEAHGFALLGPVRLDQHLGTDSTGRDLLDLFSTTEAGDSLGAESYTVLVRHAADPSPRSAAAFSSPGWILGSATGSLLLCGVGYLRHWQPDHPAHHRVAVPPDWYETEVRGHAQAEGADDGTYEFVLTSTPTRPVCHADPAQRFAIRHGDL
ncbi:hypothetical protein ACLQ2S_06520 [Micromonospora sp. DT48]|uniref:hypothetical protein n=1 Tax=Micromonospora sp. DT48 TaxID=3393429 RepID=UPI003CE8FAD5